MLSAEMDWKIECPKIKPKKKESKSKVNTNDSDSSGIHFLSPLLVDVQRNLSEFWIWVLPIMFVQNENGLLDLEN